MDNVPRQTVVDIIRTYGHGLCDDPRRCRALLNDLCPGYTREINVLIDALDERVAHALLHSMHPLPAPMVLEQLTQRLMDNRALVYAAARWAVESWALALGIFDGGQGTGNRKQGIGDRGQGIGDRGQGIGDRETGICGKREYVQEYDVHNHFSGPASPVSGPPSTVQSVAFSPDGHSLAVATENGAVLLWRVQYGHGATIEPLQQLQGHRGKVYQAVFSPTVYSIIATVGADTTVRVWDRTSGRELQRLVQHHDHVYSVAFSCDGQLLASGGVDKALCLWDATSTYYSLHAMWRPHYVWSLAFSADGQFLASAGADKRVYVWARQGHRYAGIARHVHGHTDSVWCVAFQDAAHVLASASADGTVRLWNLAQSDDDCCAMVLHGHTAAVRCVAFSPNGQLLASGSMDGTLCLWNVENIRNDTHVAIGKSIPKVNARCVASMPAHAGGVYGMAFSPDGSLLASGGADGYIRLWETGERVSGRVA